MKTPHPSSLTESPQRPLWIVGAGAVGTTLGTLLSTQRAVTLVTRACDSSPALPTVSGARTVVASRELLRLTTLAELQRPTDGVDAWLAVKANTIDEILPSLCEKLPPGSTLVVFSNGLGIYDQIRKRVHRSIGILRALPSFGAYRSTPATVVLAGELVFTIAGEKAVSSDLLRLAQTLATIGASVTTENDITLAEWRKAIVNLIVNPICALARRPNGALVDDPILRRMVPSLLEEIVAVTAAAGVSVEVPTADDFLARLAPHRTNLNSMLIDLQHGRPTELDHIAGRFLEVAQRHDVPAPLTRALYQAIKRLE